MSHDPSQRDAHKDWRRTVEQLADTSLELAASNAWTDQVVGAFADRNPGHAAFGLWDAVQQRIGDGTADKWDVAQLGSDQGILRAYLDNFPLYAPAHARLAKFLLDGAFAASRCTLAIAGASVDFAASLQEAVRAYASFWHGDDLAVKSAPLALSAYTSLNPKDAKNALLRIDEHFPAFEVVGQASAAQDAANAVQVAHAMVRYALRWLFKNAKGPSDLDLLPEPGDADRRWTTIAFVAEGGLASYGVLGMLTLNRQGWPNPAGVFFPDPVALGITVLDDDWRRGFAASQEAAWEYALSVKSRNVPRDVCWRVGPLPSHRDGPDDRSYRRPLVLEGASASGAAACGLAAFHCDWPLDRDVCFTGEIDKAGTIRNVSGKADKFTAVAQEIGEQINGSTVLTILVGAVGLTDHDRQWWAGFASKRKCEVTFITHLATAVDRISGLLENVRNYLTTLLDLPNQDLPAYLNGRQLSGPRGIYQSPDVLMRISSEESQGTMLTDRVGSLIDEQRLKRHDTNRIRVSWTRERRNIRRAVILGGPGDGKTTLVRMTIRDIALTALRQITMGTGLHSIALPICIQLDDVARCGAIDLALQKATAEGSTDSNATLANFMVRRLSSENTWLFLDGLDEVTGPKERKRLKKALGALPEACRVVVTSRPYGYERNLLASGALKEYVLAPLTTRQRRHFIRRYFRHEAKRQRQVLDVVQSNPQFGDLTRNALLLTLTCASCESPHFRPSEARRVDLYRGIARHVVRKGWKDDAASETDIHVSVLLRLVRRIAWELFSADPATGSFPDQSFLDAVALAIGEHSLPLLEATVKELESSGLIVSAGVGRRRFLHRTFLEFFAAEYIAEAPGRIAWIDRFLWQPDADGVLHWQPAAAEMLCFLAGCINDPAPLFQRLDLTHGDQFVTMAILAGRMMADSGESFRAQPFAIDLTRFLVKVICSWNAFGLDTPALASAVTYPSGIDTLIERLSSDANEQPRTFAASALGEIGSSKAVPALVNAMRADEAPVVRSAAATAMGQIGATQAMKALIERMTGDPEAFVRSAAMHALIELGSRRGIEAVCRWLPQDPDDGNRAELVRRFEGVQRCETLRVLIQLATKDRNAVVRRCAAHALALFGKKAGLNKLRKRWHRERNSQVWTYLYKAIVVCLHGRKAEAIALRMLDEKEELSCWLALNVLELTATTASLDAVIRQLEQGTDPSIREMAVKVLSFIGGERSSAALLGCLQSETDAQVRCRAIDAIRVMSSRSAESALLERVQVDSSSRVRERAALALGYIGTAAAVSVLIECVRSDESDRVRHYAAMALGQLGGEAAVNALLEEYHSTRDSGFLYWSTIKKAEIPRILKEVSDRTGRFISLKQ